MVLQRGCLKPCHPEKRLFSATPRLQAMMSKAMESQTQVGMATPPAQVTVEAGAQSGTELDWGSLAWLTLKPAFFLYPREGS